MLSSIMKTAWNLFRRMRDFLTFGECLKMAWMNVRAKVSHVATISTSKGRVFVAAWQVDATQRELIAAGVKVYGNTTTRVVLG